MLLLISWMIIYGFNLPSILYWVALVIWIINWMVED